MTSIRCYHVKHKLDFIDMLKSAQKVADYAVQNKNKPKVLTTKYVKHHGLPSAISCQILRKYGRGTIKKATNVNLIVPNPTSKQYTMKNGTMKTYNSITYEGERVHLKALKLSFRWNPGKPFVKIHQVEIDEKKFMITVSFQNEIVQHKYTNVVGIDLNCGVGRSVANVANLLTGELLNLGKQGPNIRKYYFKKRQHHKIQNDGEKRKMRDLDHKISKRIVDYAFEHEAAIVVEDLKGIRKNKTKGNGSKTLNRFVNSWSFYRLQSFIEYKAKERGIPFIKVKPHYTSQECSYCSVLGQRDRDTFVCWNKRCKVYEKKRHSDINAAFNIGKRAALVKPRKYSTEQVN